MSPYLPVKDKVDSDNVLIRLTNHRDVESGMSWSPDGSKIVFVWWTGTYRNDLYTMDADGQNQLNVPWETDLPS